MKRLKVVLAVVTSMLLLVVGAAGCSAKTMTNVLPYIPPAYFSAQLATPFELSNIYYSPYTPSTEIEKLNGNIYVFKSLPVDKITMASINQGYVWIDVVKAYALNPENLRQLKLGETVDIAGVLSGPCRDFPKSLTFTSVVFLPAGTVEMPVGGGDAIQYTPTY